jgi:hypothetical protein
MVIGVLLYIIAFFNGVLAWYVLLKDKYRNLLIIDAYKIIGISQITKYIPGNVGHLIGKAYLAKKIGIEVNDIIRSMTIENILLLYAGCISCLGYFIYFPEVQLPLKIEYLYLTFIAFTFALAVYVMKSNANPEKLLSLSKVIVILGLNLSIFLILGLVLLLLQQLTLDYEVSLLTYTIAFAISFIAGFVVPGSPGGLGVRETIFVLLMAPKITEVNALNLIVSVRLISVFADVVIYFISIKLKSKII